MNKMAREIVAVSADYVRSITDEAQNNGGFVAFSRPGQYEALLAHCITRQRGVLEEDPSFKQIIPYLVLTHGDRVFYYVRPGGISEQRLANKISIGVGGHVELEDLDHAGAAILAAAVREAKEEIGEDIDVGAVRPLGFIYTEATPVDRVHLGVLMIGKVAGTALRVKADEISGHGFADSEHMHLMLQGDEGGYAAENWTAIAWQQARQHMGL